MKSPAPICPHCERPMRRIGEAGHLDCVGSPVDRTVWYQCGPCHFQWPDLRDSDGRELRGIDLVRESAKRPPL